MSDTVRTVLRIDGAPQGALESIQRIQSEAGRLGAAMVKVSENVNRNSAASVERLQARLTALNSKLQQAQHIQQFGNVEKQQAAERQMAEAKRLGAAATLALEKAEDQLARARNAGLKVTREEQQAETALAKAQQALLAHQEAMVQKQAALAARKDTTSKRAVESAQRQQAVLLEKEQQLLAEVAKAEQNLSQVQARHTQQQEAALRAEAAMVQAKRQGTEALEAERRASLAITEAKREEQRITTVVNTTFKQLAATEKQLAEAEAQVVSTSYRVSTGLRETAASILVGRNAAQGFIGNLLQLGQRLQMAGAEGVLLGRSLLGAGQSLLAAGRSLGSLREKIAAGTAAWRTYAQATRQMGLINGNAGPSFAALVKSLMAAARAGTSWQGVATHLGQAVRQLGTAAAAGVRGVVQLGAAFGQVAGAGVKVVGHLGQLVATAGRAVSALNKLRSSSSLVGAAFAQTGTHIGGIAIKLQGAQMGLYGAGGALTGFGAQGKQVFGDLLQVAGDFEQKIITIGAVLGRSADQAKGPLRELAIDLGKLTMFSPNDAADVATELVKGGIKMKAILGETLTTVGEHGEKVTTIVKSATKAVLDMAAASGEPLDAMSRAIISATTIWSGMKLEANDAADIIVKAANASAASVADLTGGMKNAGAVAAIMGVDIKQTMLALGALANAGLKGPESGTALRYFLLNLIPSTQKSIELMKEKNLLVFKTQAALKELAGSGQEFENTQESMLDALYRKYTGGVKSFTQAIEDEDTAVNKFQQYLTRQGIVHSKFVDEKTGELKDMGDILQQLHDLTKDMEETDAVKLMSALFGERGGSKGAAPFLIAFRANLAEYEEKRKAGKLTETDDINLIRQLAKEMDTYGSPAEIAAERTKGFAGSLEYLQSSLEGAKILLGEPLLQPMAAFLRMLGDIVNKVADWAQANPELIKLVGTLGLLATAFASVAGPLVMLAAAWPYLISGLSGLALAAAPLTVLVGGLAVAFYGIYKALSDPSIGLSTALANTAHLFQVILPEALATAKEVFGSTVTDMGTQFGHFLVDRVIPAINQLILQLPALIKLVGSFVRDTAMPLARTLAETFGRIGVALFQALQANWPRIQAMFQQMRAIILPVILSVANTFVQVLPAAIRIGTQIFLNVLLPVLRTLAHILITNVIPFVRDLALWLGTALPPILQRFGALWRDIIGPALGNVAFMVADLFRKLMDLWNSVSVWLLPVLDFLVRDTLPRVVLGLRVVWLAVSTVIAIVKGLSDILGGVVKGLESFFGVAKKGGEEVKAGLKDGLNGTDKYARDAGKGFDDELAAGLREGQPGVRAAVGGIGESFQTDLGGKGTSAGTDWLSGLLGALTDGGNKKRVQDAGASMAWLLASPEVTQTVATRAIDKYTQQAQDDANLNASLRERVVESGRTLADLLGEQRVQDQAKDAGARIILAGVEGMVDAGHSPEVQSALERVSQQATEVLSVTMGHTIEAGIPTTFDIAFKNAAGQVLTSQVPFWSETGQALVEHGLASPEVMQTVNKRAVEVLTQWVKSGADTLDNQQVVILNATLRTIENGTATPEVMKAAEDQAAKVMNRYIYAADKTLTSDEMKLVLALAGVDNAASLADPKVQERLAQLGNGSGQYYVQNFVAALYEFQPDVMNASADLASSADNEVSRAAAANAGGHLGDIVRNEYQSRLRLVRQQMTEELAQLGAAKAARQEAEDMLATKQAAYKGYYNEKALAVGRQDRLDRDTDLKDLRNTGKANLQAGRKQQAAAKIAAAARQATTGPGSGPTTGTGGGPTNPDYNRNTLSSGTGGGGGGGSTTKRSPAEEAADVAKKIADAVKAGIDALRRISGLRVPSNLAQKAAEFANAVAVLVMAFQSVSLRFKEEAMKHTEAFADTASKSVDVVSKGIDAFAKFGDMQLPAKASLDSLVDTVDYTVSAFSQVAMRYQTDVLTQTDIYADAAGKAVDLVGKAADSLVKAKDFQPPARASIASLVNSVDQTVQLVAPLADQWSPELLEILGTYADNVGKAVDSLSKASDLFQKLLDPKYRLGDVRQRVQELAAQSAAMMVYLADLWRQSPGWTTDNVEKVGTFAENTGKVADGLNKSMDFLTGLSTNKTAFAPLADRVRELANAAQQMMNVLGPLTADWTHYTEDVGQWAETSGKVADGLNKTMEFLGGLDKSKVSFKDLAHRVQELANAAQHMMNTLGPLTVGWTDFTAETAAFADSAGKVADSLNKTMDFFAGLEKNKTPFRNLADRVQELINAVADIMARIRGAVPTDYEDAGLTAYVDAAEKTAGALGAVFDLLAKLGGKVKLGSTAQAQALAEQTIALFQAYKAALVAAEGGINETTAETDTLAAGIAENQGKLISTLSAAFDLWAKAGQAVKNKTDPGAVIQTLLRFLLNVVQQFRAAREQFAEAVDAETAQLAEDIGKTVGGLGGALDLFEKLEGFHGVSNGRIDRFIESLRYIVQRLKTLPGEIAPELLDLAQEFGEKLGPAFDVLGKALDLFIGITGEESTDENGKTTVKGGLRPVDPAAIGHLIESLRLVVVALRDGLLNQIAPETIALAEEFGTKMGPAIDTISKALDIFLKIQGDDEKSGLKPIDPDAIGAVVGSIYLLLHHWRNVITGGEFQGDFAARSEEFSGTVERVVTVIETVLALVERVSKINADLGSADGLTTIVEQLKTAMTTLTAVQVPELKDGMTDALNSIADGSKTRLGETAGSFLQMFADVRADLETQVAGKDENSLLFLWSGKDPKKSLLYRMWFALEGKNGFRPTIRLAFGGLWADLQLQFDNEGTALALGWEALMARMAKATVDAIDSIKAALAGLDGGVTVDVNGGVGANAPHLATGGIAVKPTLALIGEGNEPEMVVPLSKAREMGFGGGSGTTNIFNIRSVQTNRVTDIAKQRRRARDLADPYA